MTDQEMKALEASMTSWEDFKWIRDAWGGPIVAKGVHTADDARRAVDMGADHAQAGAAQQIAHQLWAQCRPVRISGPVSATGGSQSAAPGTVRARQPDALVRRLPYAGGVPSGRSTPSGDFISASGSTS